MRIAYFDCFSGVSGDMILGAMIDAGVETQALQKTIQKLKLPGLSLEARRTRKAGFAGIQARVVNRKKLPPFESFREIEKCLRQSALPLEIQKPSIEIFRRLAQAEAAAHGRRVDRTHLHEVGEIDTLVDVVGAVAGLSLLEIDRVIASPIHVGAGTVRTGAGLFPIPAPATAILLKGRPLYATGAPGELATPTGAAILTTLASEFAPLPLMTVEKIGSGAGEADRNLPNLLRLFIGTTAESYAEDEIVQIETNIDDMNPQIYEYVIDRLFSAGALDVFLTPIIMKRGRPAILLTALAAPSSLDQVSQVLFTETTTLGVRIQKMGRRKMERKIERKKTAAGAVRIKTAFQNGKPLRARAEFRDLLRLARKEKRPLQSVWEEIHRDERR